MGIISSVLSGLAWIYSSAASKFSSPLAGWLFLLASIAIGLFIIKETGNLIKSVIILLVLLAAAGLLIWLIL